MKISRIGPIAIYLAGLGGLFFSDVLVSKFFSSGDVAAWSKVRSLIGVLSALTLLGIDQVFVRAPRSHRLLFRILKIQLPVTSVILGVCVVAIGFVSSYWVAILLAFSSGLSMVLFQYCRAIKRNVISQLAQQLWKIVLAGYVGLKAVSDTALDTAEIVGLMCFSIALVALCSKLVKSQVGDSVSGDLIDSVRGVYRIGSRFVVTATLLSLAVYAEQLVVNLYGSVDDAANYFRHVTYFAIPISLVNGYVAFLVAPWIRDNYDRFVNYVSRYRAQGILCLLGYTLLCHLLGWAGVYITSSMVAGVDLLLAGAFLFSCFFRTIYMIPAGYLGVFGTTSQHDKLIAMQVGALLFSVLLFVLLKSIGVAVIYAVCLSSTFNWIIRTLASVIVAIRIHRERAGLI